MLLAPTPGLDLVASPAGWESALAAPSATPANLEAFGAQVADVSARHSLHPVIVDNTSSGDVAAHYLHWLRKGIHIVTPNKKFNTGPMADYLEARRLVREEQRALYFYEATCGAGLPVISTLKHFLATGDRAKGVQGILSGTLSYLFNTYDPASGMKWSELVRHAKDAGYTEPDPRWILYDL
jgi:bifunctional aspartokinase / homoserine dehydrogenase 1